MASVSVSGVGSGLDLASLLTQLIDAEKKAPTARLNATENAAKTQLSALGTIKSALAELRTSVDSLKTLGAFARHTATSEDADLFTAAADDTAIPNRYDVEVQALARAAKLASAGFATPATVVGTGTLTIGVGANAFSLTIGATNNTLAGIRDAINGAAGNTGVRASIITANDGAHLVLTAQQTGTDHALTVTRSGGDGGLDALVYNPGVLENLTVKQAAADATVVVDGFTHTSHSNTVTGVINGVTLTLKGAELGTTRTLTVAADTGAVKTAVQAFVASYNKLVTTVAAATKYNPATQVAAPLAGDSLPRSISAQLRTLLGSVVAGQPDALDALSDIGLTTATDGQLTLDEGKLAAALDGNFDTVRALFGGASGYATRMATLLTGFTGAGGIVADREHSLDQKLTRIGDQREELQRRLDAMETRLRAQFTALDQLVSKMNSASAYLTQQLASLNKSTGS